MTLLQGTDLIGRCDQRHVPEVAVSRGARETCQRTRDRHVSWLLGTVVQEVGQIMKR